MAGNKSSRRSSSSSSGKSTTQKSTPVSPARLSQKSGLAHSFGGYTKINHRNGTFSMKKTGGK